MAWMGWGRAGASALAAASLFFGQAPMAVAGLLDREVVITQAQLQQRVDAMRPIRVERMHFGLALPHPTVALVRDGAQVEVSSDMEVSAPPAVAAMMGLPASWPGRMRARGKLRYEASTGSFYIDEPKVVELDIQGVPEKFKPKAVALAQMAADQYLATRPVFVLKDGDLKQRMAKALLKSVSVRGEELVVVLGF